MSTNFDVLTAFKLTIDGTGANGEGESCNLPKIVVKTEEYMGGGMLGSIDVPMGTIEKMEFDCKLNSFNGNAFAHVAATPSKVVECVLRGSISRADGTRAQAIARMRGCVTEVTFDEISVGKKVQTALKMAVQYYKLEVAGVTKMEVDVNNFTFVQDGVDALAEVRQNLGI
jgi:uncharacterized protein